MEFMNLPKQWNKAMFLYQNIGSSKSGEVDCASYTEVLPSLGCFAF